MSVLVRHFIAGEEFVPINADSFTLSYNKTSESGFTHDFTPTATVALPEDGYRALLQHLNVTGVQRAIPYNIQIAGQNRPFMVDLSQGAKIARTNAEVNIQRLFSAENLESNLKSLTFELLFQEGFISQSDFKKIPYVIVQENQGEKLLLTAYMITATSIQIYESVVRAAQLVSDLILAVTPSVVVPAGATINVGAVIRYAILLAIEIAKLVFLILTFIAFFKMFFDIIFPKIRYYQAMTFDRLLQKSLAYYGYTYSSSLASEFGKCTVIGVPIDEKQKKFFEIMEGLDERLLNRGYPTSSDTVPTAMSLIDEIKKIFNLEVVVLGNVVHLEPKGWKWTQNKAIVSWNKNLQDEIEQEFEIDTSGIWNTKIISYTNDISDKMLFDNPKGLRCELLSYDTMNPVFDEYTCIKGLVDVRINFALCAIKKQTELEKQLKALANICDQFLGTSFLSLLQNRDGIMAVSTSQWSVTKMIYQQNGKAIPQWWDNVGALALQKKYHYVDNPEFNIWLNYNAMPLPLNNEQFLGITENNVVSLENQKDVEVFSCDYVPEENLASISYRERNLQWGKHIKTKVIYSE